MRIYNAKVFCGGAFELGGVDFDEKIRAVGAAVTDGELDAGGMYLIPGLVDIHSHAAVDKDASDGDPEALGVMARHYAAGGVTAWCPTTMTLPEETLAKAVALVRDYRRAPDGAKAVGVHLEGPFLSYAKRGAQAAENLRAPDAAMFHRLQEAAGGMVRLITVAPEEPQAEAFIREVSQSCTVSLGHTTADYDCAMAAFAAGASHVTHLYNAMPPLHHREPSLIAAAMDAGATVELICDGIHSHAAVVRLTQRLFGEKLVLISDSMRCAGLADGEYSLGGQPVTVKNGKATITGTDTIAGSSIHLMDGLRKAVEFGLPLEAAITAATLTPARVIGLQEQLGSLERGKCADFVLLDERLQVKAVYIDGQALV